MKSQDVRLLDVTLLGPFMLFLAMKGSMSVQDRALLGLIGAGTILYNLHHYRKIAEETAAEISTLNPEGVRG